MWWQQELLAYQWIIESRHRPTIDSKCSRRDNEVSTLQRAVSECSDLRPRRVVLKRLLGCRNLREGFFGMLPEVDVETDDDSYWCFHSSEST